MISSRRDTEFNGFDCGRDLRVSLNPFIFLHPYIRRNTSSSLRAPCSRTESTLPSECSGFLVLLVSTAQKPKKTRVIRRNTSSSLRAPCSRTGSTLPSDCSGFLVLLVSTAQKPKKSVYASSSLRASLTRFFIRVCACARQRTGVRFRVYFSVCACV